MIRWCVKKIDGNGDIFLYVANSKQEAISFYNKEKFPNSYVISLLDYIIKSKNGDWYIKNTY